MLKKHYAKNYNYKHGNRFYLNNLKIFCSLFLEYVISEIVN